MLERTVAFQPARGVFPAGPDEARQVEIERQADGADQTRQDQGMQNPGQRRENTEQRCGKGQPGNAACRPEQRPEPFPGQDRAGREDQPLDAASPASGEFGRLR